MNALADYDLAASAVIAELYHARADVTAALASGTRRSREAALFDARQSLRQAACELEKLTTAVEAADPRPARPVPFPAQETAQAA